MTVKSGLQEIKIIGKSSAIDEKLGFYRSNEHARLEATSRLHLETLKGKPKWPRER